MTQTLPVSPAQGPVSEVARLLVRRHELLLEMMRRDISDRYAGQWFGTLWAVGHPFMVLLVYVVVFSFIVKSKVVGDSGLTGDYAMYLLSGAVPWMAFHDAMVKSCTSVTSRAGLVKQVLFPVEILPIASVASPALSLLLSLLGILLYAAVSPHTLSPLALAVPFLVACQMLAMIGVGLMFSAVSVYFRDVKDLVQVFGLIGIYLTPVFYLPGWMPEPLRPLLYLNPFSYLVWCYQDSLYTGRLDHPWAWVAFVALTAVALYLGCRTFRHLKAYFGSAL